MQSSLSELSLGVVLTFSTTLLVYFFTHMCGIIPFPPFPTLLTVTILKEEFCFFYFENDVRSYKTAGGYNKRQPLVLKTEANAEVL